jgi:hypothetical protein
VVDRARAAVGVDVEEPAEEIVDAEVGFFDLLF